MFAKTTVDKGFAVALKKYFLEMDLRLIHGAFQLYGTYLEKHSNYFLMQNYEILYRCILTGSLWWQNKKANMEGRRVNRENLCSGGKSQWSCRGNQNRPSVFITGVSEFSLTS